jgi:hypothetical protein
MPRARRADTPPLPPHDLVTPLLAPTRFQAYDHTMLDIRVAYDGQRERQDEAACL